MLLTLSQMAEQLNCSVRTLSKDIKEKQVPYTVVGRSMRFDPLEVKEHLRRVGMSNLPTLERTGRFPRVTKYDAILDV